MMFSVAIVSFLFTALNVRAQTTATTLQPVFELPLDGTSTIYEATITATSSVDCRGSSLVVSTFRAVTNTSAPATPTATTTKPVTTSSTYLCSPTPSTNNNNTTAPSTPTLSFPTPSPTSPTIDPAAQPFINELSTAILYASLYSNGGDQGKLCSIINPSGLDEITNPDINGTAVQSQVCALASIQFANPAFADTIIAENRVAVSYLATALFAVQVAGGYAGGTDLGTLCGEIDASFIDNIFIDYVPDVGTAAKNFVCSAASAAKSKS